MSVRWREEDQDMWSNILLMVSILPEKTGLTNLDDHRLDSDDTTPQLQLRLPHQSCLIYIPDLHPIWLGDDQRCGITGCE